MSEGAPEMNRSSDVTDSSGSGPLAYRLVLTAILCVSAMFVVVMAIFGFLGVFDEATQVVAALSSAFAVIGTLVGAYIGIKASSEARDTVEKVQRETAGPMREVAKQATNAAVSAEKAAWERAIVELRIQGAERNWGHGHHSSRSVRTRSLLATTRWREAA